jgi:hypothetical protein
MTQKTDTWLPNLVEGVSIWKLARDLNEPQLMDGRLLVPEVEGSESMPTTVRWNTERLLPLAEAKAQHGSDLDAATKEFFAALDRVAKVFGKEASGYDRFRSAFTVPAQDADAGAHYFYDTDAKKLLVANWGASPRDFGAKSLFFGWEQFGEWGAKAALGAAAVAAAAAAAASPVAAAPEAPKKDDDDQKKPEEDKKGRPWWHWLLLVLGLLAIVLLILLLLRGCDDPNAPKDAAPDAISDASLDADADASLDADADASHDADADAANDADADASKDADAGKDADASKDASKDAADDDDDDDDDSGGGGGGGGGSGGGGGGSGGGGSGGGGAKITIGPAGKTPADSKGGAHRRHYHKDAVAWRVSQGYEKVAKTKEQGARYDVYLGPGKTFDTVRVEYKDKAGTWHVH